MEKIEIYRRIGEDIVIVDGKLLDENVVYELRWVLNDLFKELEHKE